MRVLENLQPAKVFYYFEEICKIPHISFHEKELSDYCVNFAKERGLFCSQDAMGNVLITADATPGYEEAEPIIMQAHLDMVGDKVPECHIDMEKEPIRIKVDGDFIRAEGTTLGGDDGIAVAYALAILDSDDIPHPKMEVVLTVSEEVGLLGASGMDLSMCQGRRLLNVDSEVEGVLTAGCAGGMRIRSAFEIRRETMEGYYFDAVLEGLRGGHSGMEIDKGRANANVLLGRFLLMLKEKAEYTGVVELVGGAKENVIPKDGHVKFLVKETDVDVVSETADAFNQMMGIEYGAADPDIHLRIEGRGVQKADVLDQDSLEKLIAALNNMPNGVQGMSMDLPGLVETSLNLGVVEMDSNMFALRFSVRSSVASAKTYLGKKVELLTQVLGGTASYSGAYPAWPYERNSRFRDLCVEIYKKQYGKEPKIDVLHAGLECGILSSKIPGLDCISIGPDMLEIHTPNERLSISSGARVWEYIKGILAAK